MLPLLPLNFICRFFYRDKYMFHQANIVPADDLDDAPISTLEYWYKRVLEEFSRLISFPVKVRVIPQLGQIAI